MVYNCPCRLGKSIGLDTALDEVNSLSSTDVALQSPILRKDGFELLERLIRADGLLNSAAQLLGYTRSMGGQALQRAINWRCTIEFWSYGVRLKFNQK